MDCWTCLEKGRRTDGGKLGRCGPCLRKKCRNFPICGNLSAGKLYCIECEHGELLAALRSRALNPTDRDLQLEQLDLRARRELAWEGKRFLHEAIECVARGILLFLDALHGDVADPARPAPGAAPPAGAHRDGFRDAA